MLFISNLRDVFKCPECKALVAHGDRFCKMCGRKFSEEDVDEMTQRNVKGLWSGHIVGAVFFVGVIVLFVMLSVFD